MNIENLLVTGGCGFIGSNFIRHLLAKADFRGRIINADNLTYAGNPENLQRRRRERGRGGISSGRRTSAMPPSSGSSSTRTGSIPSAILPPSPMWIVPSSGRTASFRPISSGRSTSSKRQGRRGAGFRLFHHISTDEVYGSLGPVGAFTEETPYRPNSPYSASKASSDHLVRAYHETYGLPTTLSNCSNNYGPYQFPEKLIPLVILNALEGKPLPVYGDGKNVRDWLYVTDHCEAIRKIMEKGRRGETYNIGGHAEMENIAIVEMICDLVDEFAPSPEGDSRRRLITFVKDRPGHDRRYAIDFTKLHGELGWSPAESFASGLRKTVRWYLENRAWSERIRSGEYQSWIREQYVER